MSFHVLHQEVFLLRTVSICINYSSNMKSLYFYIQRNKWIIKHSNTILQTIKLFSESQHKFMKNTYVRQYLSTLEKIINAIEKIPYKCSWLTWVCTSTTTVINQNIKTYKKTIQTTHIVWSPQTTWWWWLNWQWFPSYYVTLH
jgi:hypothetical protein